MAEAISQTTVPPAERPLGGSLILRLGSGAVLVFTLAAIGLASTGLTPFSILAGLFPGTNLTLALTVGMGVCLILAFTYAVMGAAVRRNAADYILTSRVVNPALAFAFSWVLVLINSLVVGVILAKAGQVTLPVFMRSIAIIADAPGMLLSAEFLSSPQGISLVGSVAVGLAFFISILPSKVNFRFMQVGMILLVVSWIVVLAMLFFPSVGFQASWDRFLGEGNFSAQLAAANAAGMQLDFSTQTMLLTGLFSALWIFYGFQAPVYIAGEVKTPARSLLVGSLGAVIVSWLVIAGAYFLLQRLIPVEWIAAQSFLSLRGEPALPWINFYAAIARPDPVLVSFVTLAWLISLLNMAQAFFLFTSRIIRAWSEDGLVPAALGYLHPQLKSPIVAILITAILAQFGVWLVAIGGTPVSAEIYFLFFAACTQLLPLLAMILAPFTHKRWFSSAGRLANLRLGPLPLVSLTGLISLVFLVALLALGVTYPALARPAMEALALQGVLVILGLVYFVIRRRAVRAGVDPFKSFPPPVDR